MNLLICAVKPESKQRKLWRRLKKNGIFDKYKAVNDNNNNRTGRDCKTCKFYDDIDEFLAGSDKVNPRFVKQTKLKKTGGEEEGSGNGDAATADPTAETDPGEDDDTKNKQLTVNVLQDYRP